MGTGMRVIAVLLRDADLRGRIARGLEGRIGVRFVDSRTDLVAAVRSGDVAAVLTEMWSRDGQSLVPELRALRIDMPSVPILVRATVSPSGIREVINAVRAGINGVIIPGEDDTGVGLQRAILDAIESSSAARLLRLVDGVLPVNLRLLFGVVANNTMRPLSVRQVAAACLVSRRTLANELHEASWPPPRRLIGWNRLVHASAMLDDLDRPIERVANDLGFPSASALCNMCRRYVGLSATQLRRRGAFDYVATAFIHECRGAPHVASTLARPPHRVRPALQPNGAHRPSATPSRPQTWPSRLDESLRI